MRAPLAKPLAKKANGVGGHAEHAPVPMLDVPLVDVERFVGDLRAGAGGGSLEEIAIRFYDMALKAKGRKPEKGSVVPSYALWNQATRLGGGLTPAHVSAIVREADVGRPQRLVDLANECRQTDCHLQAVLGTGEETIAGLPYQVVVPEKAKARDRKAAIWVEEILKQTPGLRRLIADLAGAYFYGFSVCEIVWKKDKGKLVPARFEHVAPRRFRFRALDGQLVLSDNGQVEVDLQEKHANKFIVAQPRANGDIPAREGLSRPLVWMSVMRRWAIGDWLHTGEMSWKPYRIGTYKQAAAGSKDKEDLESILQRLTTDFSAVKSDACEIDIEWPSGNGSRNSTHGEIVNVLGTEMSKAVLGQTETTEASASSGYAQAKVHDEVRQDIRDARASEIAAIITRDLVAAMIRLNFGAEVAIPCFEFVTKDAVDMKSFSEGLVNLVAVGLKVPAKWVRDEAGIPEPEEGEEVLEAPAAPAAAAPAGGKAPDGSAETPPAGGKKPDAPTQDPTPEPGY